MDPLIGRLVGGRFKVLSRLAAGGMGVVYQAEQQPLGRLVAFKILEVAKSGQDESFSQRFVLEASAAAKLAHPNTIVVYDYGKTDDGLYFIAMELLKGGTLGRRIKKEGPLVPTHAIHVGMQIVSSLRDAHEQGLVHRDLKPGNVMFAPRGGDPLFVKVLDFGLVKVVGEQDLHLTRSGVMMGSPRYMAPEQVKAQAVDQRTDIYSFGAVLYHMLTGSPPFNAGNAFEAMNHHVYTAAPPLRSTWAGCAAGPQLEALVLRCLAKEPAHRFQSMDEVMQGLRACHAEAGAVAEPGSYLSASHNSTSGGSDSGSYPGSGSRARSAPQGAPSPLAAHFPPASGSGSQPGHDSQPSISQPSISQPSISQSGVTPSHLSRSGLHPQSAKTMRFEGPPSASALPAAASFPTDSGAVPSGPSSSGLGLKLALGGLLLLVAAAAAAGAALLIPMGDEPTAESPPLAEGPSGPATPPIVDEAAAQAARAAAEQAAAAQAAAAQAAQAPPQQTALQAEPETTTLQTVPAGASVRRDGADLGDAPLPLLIPRGEQWTVEVSHEGYQTRTVTLAGGQPELVLHLVPEPESRRRFDRRPEPVPPPQVRPLAPVVSPPPVVRPRGRSDVYAPDLDNPWAR